MNRFLAGLMVGVIIGVGGVYLASEVVERKISSRIKSSIDVFRERAARKIEPDPNR